MTPKVHEAAARADGRRFAVIASRFNDFIVDKLIAGALDALGRAGATEDAVEIFRCPGAFEIPGVARRVADSGRFAGIVCLGVVIRGETPHFDLVAGKAAGGVAHIVREGKVGVGFAVLACETVEQALDRAGGKTGNRGFDAAMVAVEMAGLYAAMTASGATRRRDKRPRRSR